MVREEPIAAALRTLSKKGFLPILKYIGSHDDSHYIEIQKYATQHVSIDRSQADMALNALSRLGLIEREILSERPIRTKYKLTKKGRAVLTHIIQIEEQFE